MAGTADQRDRPTRSDDDSRLRRSRHDFRRPATISARKSSARAISSGIMSTGCLRSLKSGSCCAQGSTLLELGGNIGTQTIYFALSGSFSRIVSVEPDPRNFELLRTNITQNKLGDLCDPGQFRRRREPKARSISSSIRAIMARAVRSGRMQPIARLSFRSSLSSKSLPRPAPSLDDVGLIWMDIEGYEPLACRSMEALLARKVPLYMEFSPVFYGPEQIRRLRAIPCRILRGLPDFPRGRHSAGEGQGNSHRRTAVRSVCYSTRRYRKYRPFSDAGWQRQRLQVADGAVQAR